MKLTIKDIDVFILTHNRADLLAETIDSVLANTIVPDKITVLDNESVDNTEEVCLSYKNKNVIYVKTFGKDGNYFKSKELASRKYLIRLHDDNLINTHFFEEMLNILNETENVAIATASYKIFFTGFETPVYGDITKKIKKDLAKQPLKKDVVLIKTEKEFMAEMIKRFNDRKYPPIGSTPFLVVKTEIFLNFQVEREKYGKADDILLYLFAFKYGNFACLCDTNACFFRAHPNRDSETDDNSLDLDMLDNWTKMYTQTFRNDENAEIWKGFFVLFYAVFPHFLKNDLAKNYSSKTLLEKLFKTGVLPSFALKFYNDEEVIKNFVIMSEMEQEIFKSYLPLCGNIRNPETKEYFLKSLSGLEKIFSIKNFTKNGVKRKYLILFNHRIRLWKVKQHQKKQ